LASIIEKRRSLHKEAYEQKKENDKLKFQLGRLQSLANLGTTTAMVAHEINNLLTPVANYADLALMHPGDEQLAKKALKKVSRNCRRATEVMEAMLSATSGRASKKEKIRLEEMIDEVFTCLARDFSKDKITVAITISPNLTVRAVPIQLQQVFMNLILNARRAMLGKGGTLDIKADDTADSVEIRIRDSGSGIKSENLQKIFEPFFTTADSDENDPHSGGSGLGLLFCKQIIDDHEGAISVDSKPGQGTSFRISLPKPTQRNDE